jgi:hypothetical protein
VPSNRCGEPRGERTRRRGRWNGHARDHRGGRSLAMAGAADSGAAVRTVMVVAPRCGFVPAPGPRHRLQCPPVRQRFERSPCGLSQPHARIAAWERRTRDAERGRH